MDKIIKLEISVPEDQLIDKVAERVIDYFNANSIIPIQNNSEQNMYSVEQIAIIANRCPDTIRRHIRNNILPAQKVEENKKAYFVKKQDIEPYLKRINKSKK